MKNSKIPFLWDYDIGEEEMHKILTGPEGYEKDWLITRILEHASWDMLWKYLDLSMIREHLPHLPLRASLKKLWEYALKRWTSNTNPTS